MSTRTSYYYKSPSIPRSGTYEKTVCYSISNSSRNFDYQNPYKTNEDITGRGIRHYAPSPSKEMIPFSQRQVYAQPNSKRTLVPELAPEPEKKSLRSHSTANLRFNSDSNEFNYISNVNNVPMNRKPCNPKVYQSFELTDSAKPEPYHRMIKPALFKKYDNTSQISYLPGAIKRDQNEINDNYCNNPTTKTTESFNTKLYRDYRSNVACLPGSVINETRNQNYLCQPNIKKNESHDIFNINSYSTDTKTNTFRRKYENTNRIFGDSNSYVNYDRPSTGIRRYQNKNRSQFELC